MAESGNSRPVESNQTGIHPGLERTVRRHAETVWRKPPGGPTAEAWRRARPLLEPFRGGGAGGADRIELDSGCGTGLGTETLFRALPPDAPRAARRLVLGADRSAARLSKLGLKGAADSGLRYEESGGGALLVVRAELADFWRFFLEEGFRAEKNRLLYPNPWPLKEHLVRRWHGHPVFPLLPRLAVETELRTNWRIYAEEFAEAWALLGFPRPEIERLEVDPGLALTPFERKYALSGHALWRLRAEGARGI